MSSSTGAAPAAGADQAGLLLGVVQGLVEELSPRAAPRVSLESLLERDLGLDSLGLVELISRLEDAFGVALPDAALSAAQTPRDLLSLLPTVQTSGPALPSTAPVAPGAAPARGQVAPEAAQTLSEALEWHVACEPDALHIRLIEASGAAHDMSYREAWSAALAAADRLIERGLGRGDRVALMLPTGRAYFVAFLGALLAGAVPVPIYPPTARAMIEEHLLRQARILDNAGARVLVSVPEARLATRLLRLQVPSLRRVLAPDDLTGAEPGPEPRRPVPVAAADTALIQYTSGSTSDPKGVVLTHANLLASIRAMGERTQVRDGDVFVSWLPLYHDMGLIGAWLASLYFGMPLVVMSPTAFLARPARWLRAVSDHRGTISASPNFGYDLCVERIRDEELAGVDLGSWRIAFNGAEPVSSDTIARFSERFAAWGFRPETMYPVYGLAEASLGVTFPPLGRVPVIDHVDRDLLSISGRAVPAGDEEGNAARVVGCGQALPGFEVRIVDEKGEILGDRQVGRVEVRGPSLSQGYQANPEATSAMFHHGWLDTGDLGYLAGGELFVTGRAKDVVIRAGRNIHPQELEEAVGAVDGIRRGRAAVFGVRSGSAAERLVVVAETREHGDQARAGMHRGIVTACLHVAGVAPDDVVLTPPGTISKTSSGKIRRAECRQRYEAGTLGSATRPPWLQLVRLGGSSAGAAARRLPPAMPSLVYGGYAWLLVWLIGSAVWLLVAVVPGQARRWSIFHKAAGLFLRLGGASPSVEGASNLPSGPFVVASNHASILDGLVLASVVPAPMVFAAAAELSEQRIAGPFLRRIGVAFVERTHRGKAAAASEQLLGAVLGGRSAAFFPEGTMARVPGLQPFRMGAFVVSAEAGVPLVPIAIRGTGAILRGDRRFPRRGRIDVVIGTPLVAPEPGWTGAIELRDQARAFLLAQLGEPDLQA